MADASEFLIAVRLPDTIGTYLIVCHKYKRRVCVCVHVHTAVCIHVHVYACTYVSVYVHVRGTHMCNLCPINRHSPGAGPWNKA